MSKTTCTKTPIPLCVPHLCGNEWDYVKQCLDHNWVSSAGAFVSQFETRMAETANARYAVATVNGTAALHMALLVAGIDPDDEVLVPTLTFIATANAVRYVGGWPVFVDAEPTHWQMDPELVENFLDRGCQYKNGILINRTTGRRVRALMPAHILGHPVEMDSILKLARRYDLLVIEDAAESLGALYKSQPVGSLGDVGCFSFNGNKIITSGGGGMFVTNNQQLAERARFLSTQAKADSLEYIHTEIGYNHRLTNILAALGSAQLEQLPQFVLAKREIAANYREQLGNLPGISHFSESPACDCSYWISAIRVAKEDFGIDSRGLHHELQAKNIQTRPLWQPMHASTAHAGSQALLSGVADQLYSECLNLPSSVSLTTEDQTRVCSVIREIHEKFSTPSAGRSVA